MLPFILAVLLGVPANPAVLSVPVAEAAPLDLQTFASTTAQQYELNPDLFVATIKCESDFDPDAIGAAGEIGLVQILPRAHPELTTEEMEDPYFSIEWMAQAWKNKYENWWSCYRYLK